jgi:hypothetical protein
MWHAFGLLTLASLFRRISGGDAKGQREWLTSILAWSAVILPLCLALGWIAKEAM